MEDLEQSLTTTRRPKKAVGHRGSWFATVDGERLPCFHKYWVKGLHYHARRVSRADPRNVELFRAIELDPRIILTKDEVTGDGESFRRTGYIAIYRISNIEWTGEDLHFDLVEKLDALRGYLQ